MKCPKCQSMETKVIDSRVIEEGQSIRRRRECESCKKRFTTYERVENVSLKVIKKSGKIEDFSREKLERCLEKAGWRISEENRKKMLDDIEMKLLNWKGVEIPSKEIGMLVMDKLKQIDPVAYVRFATVFLDINSVDDFKKLLVEFKEK